jgi:hypothetical protein
MLRQQRETRHNKRRLPALPAPTEQRNDGSFLRPLLPTPVRKTVSTRTIGVAMRQPEATTLASLLDKCAALPPNVRCSLDELELLDNNVAAAQTEATALVAAATGSATDPAVSVVSAARRVSVLEASALRYSKRRAEVLARMVGTINELLVAIDSARGRRSSPTRVPRKDLDAHSSAHLLTNAANSEVALRTTVGSGSVPVAAGVNTVAAEKTNLEQDAVDGGEISGIHGLTPLKKRKLKLVNAVAGRDEQATGDLEHGKCTPTRKRAAAVEAVKSALWKPEPSSKTGGTSEFTAGTLSEEQTAVLLAPAMETRHDAEAREEPELYCYCRAPYNEDDDSDSAMIGCDGNGCSIEWFHLRCCNITVAPKGAWYCDACREKMTGRKRRQASISR